jgi:anti-sigma-K factor RskA
MSPAKRSQREEMRELLPWYATGVLSQQEAKPIEQALAEDPELARDFELIREEMAQTINRNELLGLPSAQAFERLMTSIDSEPRSSRASVRSPISRIAEFLSRFSARNLSWAATAAAVVLVVQAGLIAELVSSNRSENGDLVRGVEVVGGSYALIRFQDNATASEISQFLQSNRLTVVAGPVRAATFRVRVADTRLSKTDLDQRIRTLQQSPIIASVTPSD